MALDLDLSKWVDETDHIALYFISLFSEKQKSKYQKQDHLVGRPTRPICAALCYTPFRDFLEIFQIWFTQDAPVGGWGSTHWGTHLPPEFEFESANLVFETLPKSQICKKSAIAT